VLADAVQVHCLPLLEAEARRLLKQRAEEGVVREAARALRRIAESGACLPACVRACVAVKVKGWGVELN